MAEPSSEKRSPRPDPKTRSETEAQLREGLKRLAKEEGRAWHPRGRMRNYFLTGLLIVGPVTLTAYLIWWMVNFADDWFKPFVPKQYLPDTYLPFAVPGVGLIVGIGGLTLIGALAANLLGRTIISYGELMLGRMPIVRNVYRALKQIFESVVSATEPTQAFQKVGLIEFPSKGLWSLVSVQGETAGEIAAAKPGGHAEFYNVFMPTGIVPPTGFVCFVPRENVTFLNMTMEDAAKIIISGGMVTPQQIAAGGPGLNTSGLGTQGLGVPGTGAMGGGNLPMMGMTGAAGAQGSAAPPEIADAMRRAHRNKPRPRR